MSGQDSNSLPFSELTILCNPLLIKPFILLARVWNRTTLLSATPCHQCTTSPPHHRFAGTYASGLVLSVFF
ncbi:hypothetical protein CPT_Mansal_034 [Salmonella phage Mansal]|nr:hypothetical protein CPT_Mansal_038 [Salmonella phage Mansal]